MQSSGILKYITPATPPPSHALMPPLSLPAIASCMERYRTPRRVKFDETRMGSKGIQKKTRASLDKVQRIYKKTPRDGDAERLALQQQQLLAESIWQEMTIHENMHGKLTPLGNAYSEPTPLGNTYAELEMCPPVSPELMPVYDDADEHQADYEHNEDKACAYNDDYVVGLEMELMTRQHTASPLPQYDHHTQYVMTMHDIYHQFNHAECITSIRDIDLYFTHDGKKSDAQTHT